MGHGAWAAGPPGKRPIARPTTHEFAQGAGARAFDLGITLYDTAPASYGDGHSEELIGSAFRDRRSQVVLATKVDAAEALSGKEPDLSPQALRHSLEGSLRRLGSDYVDLLQIHSLDIAALRRNPAILETLNAMVDEGKSAAAPALTAKSPDDAVAAVTEFGFKIVQINLNMMDLRAQQNGFLALAANRRHRRYCQTPLCFGFLSGTIGTDTQFPDGDHRNGWSRAQIERWIEGASCLHDAAGRPEGQTRAQVALRFCLSYPAVAVVIPGILTAAEADENAAASTAAAAAVRGARARRRVELDHGFLRSARRCRPNAGSTGMKKRNILVCGATGFIGRNTAEALARRADLAVTGVYNRRPPFQCPGLSWVKADLTRADDVARIVSGADVIVQAAATTSGIRDTTLRPHIHIADNAVMNSLIFRAAHDRKVRARRVLQLLGDAGQRRAGAHRKRLRRQCRNRAALFRHRMD